MNVSLRGPGVLVAGIMVATALVAQSPSASASPTNLPRSVKTVFSCSQNVPVGHYACFAERRADLGFTAKSHFSTNPQITPQGYGPSGLESAYALPSSSAGSGQRVFIVDAYDNPNAASDLAVYRAEYGLPACTVANGCFQKLNQNGGTSPLPAANADWASEESLDLDMVSAICPNCAVTLVEASSDTANNLFIAAKAATTVGAKFVSMSWGGPDYSSDSTYDSNYFKSSGVVYAASAGDGGYGAMYPATSPDVVAVGGTSLGHASNSRGWTETAWNGAGSGCSSNEAKPSWQNIISATTCSRRATADVSAVADPNTGVAVYTTYGGGGGWAVYGGTSAAAPIIASTYALAGAPAPTDQPGSFPYSHTANLNDVTSGHNGTCPQPQLCTAAAGWDGPTGLGTPSGTAAFTSGGGGTTANTITVTNPGPQSGTVGTAASLPINATDSAGLALTYRATLPTGLSINAASGLISGTPSTAGTFSVTVTASDSTNAAGSAVFSWTIGPGDGVGCSGQKIINPGFESGATSWTATLGVVNTDGAHPHTGTGYSWLDGYGTSHTDTLSQSIKVPAGCSVTLTYYLLVSSTETTRSAQYDKLAVTANGTTVQAYSNLDKGTSFVQRTVNLSSFAGKTVTLKWTGTEDSSLATSFFVDDTALTLS